MRGKAIEVALLWSSLVGRSPMAGPEGDGRPGAWGAVEGNGAAGIGEQGMRGRQSETGAAILRPGGQVRLKYPLGHLWSHAVAGVLYANGDVRVSLMTKQAVVLGCGRDPHPERQQTRLLDGLNGVCAEVQDAPVQARPIDGYLHEVVVQRHGDATWSDRWAGLRFRPLFFPCFPQQEAVPRSSWRAPARPLQAEKNCPARSDGLSAQAAARPAAQRYTALHVC